MRLYFLIWIESSCIKMRRLLIVEDDFIQQEILKKFLYAKFELTFAVNIIQAKKILVGNKFDFILMDFELGDGTAIDLLNFLNSKKNQTPSVVLSAFASIPKVVESLKIGAKDFLEKPVVKEDLLLVIHQYIDVSTSPQLFSPSHLVYQKTSPFVQTIKLAHLVANKSCPIFLHGETGTGKEELAKIIHSQNSCSQKIVSVNFSAIPENLIEAELFGYMKGAFTGAVRDYKGIFEQAHNGTLFLDEIGDLPLPFQTKLLRVLQDKRVTPLGSNQAITVNFRLVTATHKHLLDLVDKGEFREDLYYRICVFTIEIPALRQRRMDIVPNIKSLLLKEGFSELQIKDLGTQITAQILNYHFPGNFRELQNLMSQWVIRRQMGDSLETVFHSIKRNAVLSLKKSFVKPKITDNDIEKALEICQGHRQKTAEYLGISKRNLQYRLIKMKDNL